MKIIDQLFSLLSFLSSHTHSQDSASYPLSSSGHQHKHFRAGLTEFVRVLVDSCQNSFIYDEFLFSSLLVLLTGLSDSQVRAFRHTSTLLGEHFASSNRLVLDFQVYMLLTKPVIERNLRLPPAP